MKRFVEGEDRLQGALLPHCLDDYVTENNISDCQSCTSNQLAGTLPR